MSDPRYEAAKKRVKEIKDFYTHVVVFVVINFGLFLIDALDGSGNLDWFYWVVVGWGVAVLIHGFYVFGIEGRFGRDWEERKINELLGEKPKRRFRGGALGDDGEYVSGEPDDDVSLESLIHEQERRETSGHGR